jgi:hypothetical protein
MKKRYTNKQKQILAYAKALSVSVVSIIVCLGMIVGLLFFARPETSTLENRALAAFPAFSFSAFFNGSYFSDISTWYADTYPGRETLLAINQNVKKLYGINTDTQFFGGGSGDEIGDTDLKTYNRTELPDNYSVEDDIQNQIVEGLLVKDGAAYAGYYFSSDACAQYINALDRAAETLEGITNVYSVLIPNNSGVVLDEQTREGLGGSDQQQAIEYYYSNYSDLVTPVDTINTLLEHSDEYLYFRTDHHWTALAAYYVYRNYCELKGWEPHELSEYETYTYEPFTGSYAVELPDADLIADSVTGYVPLSTNTLTVYASDGDYTHMDAEAAWTAPIFSTTDNLDQYNQYMRFIQGDQGLEVIDNPDIDDGSTLMIVKESYGNVLVPFLVDHYDKIYVVDFRYNDGDLVTFCKENNITDLMLSNNIQLIASTGVAAMYDALLQ